jgi:hypothetical protein
VIRRDARPPFAARWNTNRVRNGRHVLTLRAYGVRRGVAVWRGPFVVANRPLTLAVAGVAGNALVQGRVRLRATVRHGPVRSVQLLVDGRLVARRTRPPYLLGWDSATARDGHHLLEVRARAVDGRTARLAIPVLVERNKPQIVSETLIDGQVVQGPVVWAVAVKGPVRRIEWLIDGKVRWTSTYLPFVFGGPDGAWDATAEPPGPHTLTVRTVSPYGTRSDTTIVVTVAVP